MTLPLLFLALRDRTWSSPELKGLSSLTRIRTDNRTTLGKGVFSGRWPIHSGAIKVRLIRSTHLCAYTCEIQLLCVYLRDTITEYVLPYLLLLFPSNLYKQNLRGLDVTLKISIFYKITMTPFDRAKFQLSESVLQITVRWFLMEQSKWESLFNLTYE